MMRLSLSVLAFLLAFCLCGCAPSIKRIGYAPSSAPPDTACALKLTKFATYPTQAATVLGKIKVGDSGLSTDCKEEDVLRLLYREGCALQADIVNITEEKQSSVFSSCYRVTAEFLKLSGTTAVTAGAPGETTVVATSFPTAAARGFDLGTRPWPRPKDQRPRKFGAWTAQHLDLATSQMDAAYGEMNGTGGSAIVWYPGHSGVLIELAYRSARGSAEILDPSWTFQKRSLNTGMLTFGLNYLYRIGGTSQTAALIPYLGAGLSGTLGTERLSIKAERGDMGTTEWIDAELKSFRTCVQAQALAGAQVKITSGLYGLVEGRWIQSGKGSTSAPEADENDPEDVAARKVFDSIARKPDWNFTGFQISAGLALAI